MSEYFKSVMWPNPGGEWFDRAHTYSTTPGFNGWTIADDSSSGTPTYVNQNGGGFVGTLVNTSEEERITLYQGDKLIFDIDELIGGVFSFFAKVSGIDAVTTLVMGVASAQNDTDDSIAAHAWFRMEGSASTSAIVVETDDGTNDNNDVATGKTLASTLKKFSIDFTNGKSDVRFRIDDSPVATATTFDMSNYSSGLQPFFQLSKASGTGTPALTLIGIEPVCLSRNLA